MKHTPELEKEIAELQVDRRRVRTALGGINPETVPDLLVALKDMIQMFWGDWMHLDEKYRVSFRREYPKHIIVKAEAALAKAKP